MVKSICAKNITCYSILGIHKQVFTKHSFTLNIRNAFSKFWCPTSPHPSNRTESWFYIVCFCLLARVVSSQVGSGCHNFLASVNGPCPTRMALPFQLSSSTSLGIYWDQECRLASSCDLRIPTYKAHQ